MKQFKEYVEEIAELKEKYDLGIDQTLLLQIAAAFKVDNKDYAKLKKEYIENAKKITSINNT